MTKNWALPLVITAIVIASVYLFYSSFDKANPTPSSLLPTNQKPENSGTEVFAVEPVSTERFEPASAQIETSNSTQSGFGINLGETGEPLTMEISGVVTDENNQPIEDVLVSDEFKLGKTRTDNRGWYQIRIEKPTFKAPFLKFRRTGYREGRMGIPVDSSIGQASFNLDVTLQQATNSTMVHGWVGNEFGAGLAGRKIEIRTQRAAGAGLIHYAVISDQYGEFSFEGIRSDLVYKLEVEASGNYAGYVIEPYKVTHNTPRTTIILDAFKMVSVDGMIFDTDNLPIANLEINVQNVSIIYPGRKISSDSSGYFKLENFPAGEVKLSTSAPQNFKITGVTLRENEYRNLNLVVDVGGYTLSGWVSDEYGIPLEKAQVTLDSIIDRDDYHSHSHRSSVTDNTGGFQFARLGGQNHTLSIDARDYDTYVLNHQFRSLFDTLQIKLDK